MPAQPLSAGDLDREISIEFKTAGKSSMGEPTETWGSPATDWANVRPLSGREFFSFFGAQLIAEETLVFRVHHRTDVRPGNARIKYDVGDGQRTYNIRRVAEIGRRDFLDIFADTKTA